MKRIDRNPIGVLIGRRLIAFSPEGGPAPEPKKEEPASEPKKEDTRTPEEIEAANALELRWKGLKLPDGVEVRDEKLPERTVTKARELGLDPDKAQVALNFVAQETADAVHRAIEDHSPGGAEWKKQVEQWEKEALKHAEIGNGSPEKLQAAVTKSRMVLDKFFPKSVKDYLQETGFGSRPDVILGFLNIAKAAGEGTFDAPKVPDTRTRAEKFYPEKKEDK